MEYILAHDLGTSGDKATLFDGLGRFIDSQTITYPVLHPERTHAEQRPADWWDAFCASTRSLLERNPGIQIDAVSSTGQMMGCLALDVHGDPIGNSIIWADSRAIRETELLSEQLTIPRWFYITGQPPSASYTLPKIMWMRGNKPEWFQRASVFVQAKDYISYRLTGSLHTDPTDADYTLAYDIKSKCWSEDILKVAGLNRELFPEVVPCETIIGVVTQEASRQCGIKAGTPVIAGAGDGSAAHIGAACIREGDAYVSLGSSTWIAAQTRYAVYDTLYRMQTEPHVLQDSFLYIGTMQTGGMAYEWAREALSQNKPDYDEMNSFVEESSPGAAGLIFLPYLMGERSPWYDLEANAAFLGIRQGIKQGDFYRAVLEGVGMNLRILLDLIEKQQKINEIVAIGGGTSSKIWQQILADIFQKTLCIPENTKEGTSLGCAVIAGVGTGIFSDYTVTKQMIGNCEYVFPRKEMNELYRKKQQIFEDAYIALKDINRRIFRNESGN